MERIIASLTFSGGWKPNWTGSPMFRYVIFFPCFSTRRAAETISRIAYSTPATFFETFKYLDRYLAPLKSYPFGLVAQSGQCGRLRTARSRDRSPPSPLYL